MYRDLIFMALSLVVWGVGEGMFILFIPLFLEDFGAEPQLIGGILGILGMAMIVSHLPAGYLADRFGRRPLLRLAWMMGTLASIVMGLANSLALFVLGNLLYALTAFVASPMNSYVTAARGNLSVGRVLTIASATFHLGAIAGPILGGWIGEQYGRQTVFWVACGFFLLSTVIIFILRPQPIEPPPPAGRQAALKDLLSGRFKIFLFVSFIILFSMYLAQPLTPNFLQNERGLSLVQIGILVSGRGLGIVLLNLILGHLNPRIGILIAQMLVSLFALIIGWGQGIPLYFVAYMLMGSYLTARSLLVAQGRALVESSSLGMAYGLYETATALVTILAPPFAGWLYTLHPQSVYIASIGLIGVAFIIYRLFPISGNQDPL